MLSSYWNKRVVSQAADWKKRVLEIKRIKFSDTAKEIRKLEHQKNLLERAYEKGNIKKISYEEGKKHINELIRKLKKRL